MERNIALIGNSMSHRGNPKSNERRKNQCRNQVETRAEAAPTVAAVAVTVPAAAERAVIAVPDGPAEPEAVPAVAAPTPRQKANNGEWSIMALLPWYQCLSNKRLHRVVVVTLILVAINYIPLPEKLSISPIRRIRGSIVTHFVLLRDRAMTYLLLK